MMFDIENQFFHGIDLRSWEYVDGIYDYNLLESILKDKYILTRSSLYKKHPQYCGNLFALTHNGNDSVSISCHYNKNDDNLYYESGFDFSYNSISIILKPSILSELSCVKRGIVGEYQVIGDISLEYMCGLGVPDFFDRIYIIIDDILKRDDYLKYRCDYYVDILRSVKDINSFLEDGFRDNGYRKYEKVEKLLKDYGYNVPIVDAFTGKYWESRNKSYKKIEDIRERALIKKLIK